MTPFPETMLSLLLLAAASGDLDYPVGGMNRDATPAVRCDKCPIAEALNKVSDVAEKSGSDVVYLYSFEQPPNVKKFVMRERNGFNVPQEEDVEPEVKRYFAELSELHEDTDGTMVIDIEYSDLFPSQAQ